MPWQKTGLVFCPEPVASWCMSHAQIPTGYSLDNKHMRVYFGVRDGNGHTSTTWLDLDKDNPSKITKRAQKPVLESGELGCFDDGGAMPSCVIEMDDRIFLYYIGWNAGVTVPYRNAIGLAFSDDNGLSFQRLYPGAIYDRSREEPQFCASSWVFPGVDGYMMYYLSCTQWIESKGRIEPRYHIRLTSSDDGVNWKRPGDVALDYASSSEGGLARPCVRFHGGLYKMWFCYRGLGDYRKATASSYRIGYAESCDGINWHRDDARGGLDVSASGWDSDMVCYPFVYEHQGKLNMLYNGNGFGASGFGHAIWDD